MQFLRLFGICPFVNKSQFFGLSRKIPFSACVEKSMLIIKKMGSRGKICSPRFRMEFPRPPCTLSIAKRSFQKRNMLTNVKTRVSKFWFRLIWSYKNPCRFFGLVSVCPTLDFGMRFDFFLSPFWRCGYILQWGKRLLFVLTIFFADARKSKKFILIEQSLSVAFVPIIRCGLPTFSRRKGLHLFLNGEMVAMLSGLAFGFRCLQTSDR